MAFSLKQGAEFRRKEREMSRNEMDYLQSRAEAEIELAQRAQNAHAVRAHYELASAYLDRIYGNSPQSAPNSVSS